MTSPNPPTEGAHTKLPDEVLESMAVIYIDTLAALIDASSNDDLVLDDQRKRALQAAWEASPGPGLLEALREFFTSGDFDIQTTGDEAATQAWIKKARAAIASTQPQGEE